MESNHKNIVKISVFVVSILIFLFSISYAFLNQTVTGTKKQVITAGNLELELVEGDTVTLENALPVYDEVGMIGKSFDFALVNKSLEKMAYVLKLKDVTEEGKDKLDSTIVKYGLTKDGEVTKDFLSNLEGNVLDEGSIPGNGTISYSLRLWIDSSVEDEILIKDKTLSYKIEVEARQEVILYPETASELVGVNLGEDCKTYDDGIDTFLVGQCKNNYVWYSGKLWRVVLKNNETGAVKMITDNDITAIPYNAENNSTFENSYADQWLNQEFLPTLHDYQDYLVVESTWDATLNNSNDPSRPNKQTVITRTVGLLNAYEYYTTYNKSDGLATYGNGYLHNSTYWRLITPANASSTQRVNADNGRLDISRSIYADNIRPSINLQESIRITAGNGTESNPYRLEGDVHKIINGTTFLSGRYSGEYVTFNDELYRIVAIENNLTKITAVDKPRELSNRQFHSDNTVTSFANANIKATLEAYYQNNVVEPYKSMVAENQSWYLGTIENGANYKASICATIKADVSMSACNPTGTKATANIGLPRVGEMFTSVISRNEKDSFWTLTPKNTSNIRYIHSNGGLGDTISTNALGARPSMYLKPNVVISKE